MIAQDSVVCAVWRSRLYNINQRHILYLGNNEGIGMAYGMNGVKLDHTRSSRAHAKLSYLSDSCRRNCPTNRQTTKHYPFGDETRGFSCPLKINGGQPEKHSLKGTTNRFGIPSSFKAPGTNLEQIKCLSSTRCCSIHHHNTTSPYLSSLLCEQSRTFRTRYLSVLELLGASNQAQVQDWNSASAQSQKASN